MNFVEKTDRHVCEPGSVTFSSGWFGQGHEVGICYYSFTSTYLTDLKTDNYQLLPSLNFRTQPTSEAANWMEKSHDFETFLNLTLSLINPDLFQTGLESLRKLQLLESAKEVAEEWQSVYTGIAIITNRITPPHRDSKGRPEWYDLLLNYCESGAASRLLISDLGLDLDYRSGTVVGLCGSILQHEVRSWGDGDRICYAHFMREAVRKRLEIPPAGWVYQKIYLPSASSMPNPPRAEDGEIEDLMDVDKYI